MRAEHISSISFIFAHFISSFFLAALRSRRSRSFTLIDAFAFVNSTVVPDYVRCAPSIADDATDVHHGIHSR